MGLLDQHNSNYRPVPPSRWVLVGFLLISATFILLFKFENAADYYRKRLAGEEYNVVVVDKYLEGSKNKTRKVWVKNNTHSYDFNFKYWINFYDLCRKGDRLIKKKGERVLYLVPEYTRDTIKIEFNKYGGSTGKIVFRF
jgi:hypothetical protein